MKTRDPGWLALLALVLSPLLLPAATIGAIVPIVGQISDLVYDGQRQLVYLSNFSQNRIEIYSVGGRRLLSPFNVGSAPAGLAISPDGQHLYVANNGSNTVSVVDLNSGSLMDDIAIGSRPDSLAVGSDGMVAIIGGAGLLRLNAQARVVAQVPISPPAAPPPGLPAPGPVPTPPGFRAHLQASSDGRLIFGMSANRLFVYEVASGTVLLSRTMAGLNASISVSPDGSKFMAGPFLFDARTLTIMGNAGLSAATLTGGTAFKLDGSTVYSTFSTQTPINPLNPNQPGGAGGAGGATQGVLQILKASNLAPQLGLRLPDNIISKIALSDDGQNLFAISASGMLVIPIGQLNQFPILEVQSDNIVLSVDICNRNVQSQRVRVSNAGGGRMTFGATSNNNSAIITQGTGLAPADLQITYDPRATQTRGTTVAVVVLVSPEAVNVEPAITVSLNFRDVDQRGNIYPVSGTIADMVMDTARQRLYLANTPRGRIEVFSIPDQVFLPPVEVGANPRSLALVGTSTLVVANSGAESISVVDLDSLQSSQIPMAPVPIGATPLFPSSIAASTNAILFSTVPLVAAGATPGNGSIWQLSLDTRTTFPRRNLGSNLGVVAPNVVDGRTVLVAPANGSAMVAVSAAGGGTLRLYDPVTDGFPITRTGAVAALRGAVAAAPDGSFYMVDNTIFDSSLAAPTTIANVAGSNIMAAAAAGNVPLRVRSAIPTGPQADPLQRIERFAPCPPYPCSTQVSQSVPMLESVVNSPFGPRGQVQLSARSLVADSPTGTAYAITQTGLSAVPLAPLEGRGPSFSAAGVVNGASFQRPVAAGSIVAIFGTELGDPSSATSVPLPAALGGTCVTIRDDAIPLFFVSPQQITAQIPPNLAAGTVTFTVRSRNSGRSSPGVSVPVASSAPGVFTTSDGTGRTVAAVFRFQDNTFSLVTPDNYSTRDEDLVLYATGLGATSPAVAAGQAAPFTPLAFTTSRPQVCIGQHPYIVTFSGLAPGFVGLYQINIRVPGDRVQDPDNKGLPVVITMGGADCRTAPIDGAPKTFVH